MTVLVALIGVLVAASVLVAVTAWTTPPPARRARVDRGDTLAAVGAGVVAGVVVLAVSGWVAFGIGAGAGAGWLVWHRAQRRRHPYSDVARLEGLAVWCEQLRDLIRARQGAVAPIMASRDTAPEAIRAEVERLANALRREDPTVAFGRFASELDDPDADLVASVLTLSMTHSGRTSDLLHELAGTIRERAAIRTRIATAQAGDRAEARFVTTVTVIGLLVPAVFARGTRFFAAYRHPAGQVMLAIVVGLVAVGLWWLARFARMDTPARFLSNDRPAR